MIPKNFVFRKKQGRGGKVEKSLKHINFNKKLILTTSPVLFTSRKIKNNSTRESSSDGYGIPDQNFGSFK
jgi:hypothetical protein